jgi:hypothetical protein
VDQLALLNSQISLIKLILNGRVINILEVVNTRDDLVQIDSASWIDFSFTQKL